MSSQPTTLDSLFPYLLLDKPLSVRQEKNLAKYIKQLMGRNEGTLSADELFVLGYGMLQNYRYDLAAEYFTKAIAINPQFEAAFKFRATCNLETGETDEALMDIEQALKLDPDFYSARFQYARILKSLNRSKDALNELDAIIENHEDYAAAYAERSALLEAEGNFEEALASINKAIELFPENSTYLGQRGLLYLFHGDPVQALKDLKKSTMKSSSNYVSQFNFALCYGMMEGKDKEAYQSFSKAFSKVPTMLTDYYKMATEYEKKRLDNVLRTIKDRLSASTEKTGAFYRKELTDLLERALKA